MSIFFKHIRNGLKGLWIYSFCFILIFNLFFLPGYANSSEVYGMGIIASFLIPLFVILLFLLTIAGLMYFFETIFLISKAFILFAVFEVVLLLLIGNIALFGLFETANNSLPKDLQEELLLFHKKRDFGLSMSNLISVLVYTVVMGIRKRWQ